MAFTDTFWEISLKRLKVSFLPDILPCFSQRLPSLQQRWQNRTFQRKAYHYT